MDNASFSPLASNGFPKSLLASPLPDYDQERFWLWIKLAGVAVFFLILLPPMFANEVGEGDKKNEAKPAADAAAVARTEKSTGRSTRSSKKGSKSKKAADSKTAEKQETSSELKKEESEYEISQNVVMGSCLAFMIAVVVVMIRSSPDNNFSPRAVFQAPLLRPEECQHILKIADAAAQRNYENAVFAQNAAKAENVLGGNEVNEGEEEYVNKTVMGLMSEPFGWQKFRHLNYPTTDLNLVTDPFTTEDQQYIKEKLDARLSPLLENIFGIPSSSIRANDMFVVRYDAGKRTLLTNHTDDGHISFNILLNDEFEGGGTQFWNRVSNRPFAHVQPKQVGQVLAHSAEIHHEGMHVTQGTRTILVGFLNVDRVDPFTGKPTGLPFLASWGSLPWAMIKFKHGIKSANDRAQDPNKPQVWWNHPAIVSFFEKVYNVLVTLGDISLKHQSINLVEGEEAREAYLDSLDAAYEHRKRFGQHDKASWFSGQQISVDINGQLTGEWTTRQTSSYRFSSAEL